MNPRCKARRRAWVCAVLVSCAAWLAAAARAGTTSAIGAPYSGNTYEVPWSLKNQPDVFAHYATLQPDNCSRNEAFGSILLDGPSASSRARNAPGNDLPLDVDKGVPDVTSGSDAGYIVEFAGNHRGAVPVHAKSAAVAAPSASTGTGTVTVPLPSAALLFPAGLGVAVYALRRMARRA